VSQASIWYDYARIGPRRNGASAPVLLVIVPPDDRLIPVASAAGSFPRYDMKLQRRALDDPERLVELEHQLEEQMTELLAEAADAGYSMAEVLIAFKIVWERQQTALSYHPDPADDLR